MCDKPGHIAQNCFYCKGPVIPHPVNMVSKESESDTKTSCKANSFKVDLAEF